MEVFELNLQIWGEKDNVMDLSHVLLAVVE